MSINDNGAVIKARQLSKHYGELKAVRELSLDIRRGEIFGLLGPNGAGKTTTLEMFVGLRTPTSGSVTVLGMNPIQERDELKKKVAIQPQHGNLFEYLTLAETIRLFASFHESPIPGDEVIEWLGLEGQVKQRVGKLSGGQQQRLLVAVALVSNAEVLLLDEPTSGLDPNARRYLWETIDRFRSQGKTIIVTTHSMEEAQAYCDRVAIVDAGRCVALGTPDGLISKHTGEKLITFTTSAEPDLPALRVLAGVSSVTVKGSEGGFQVGLITADSNTALQAFMESAHSKGVSDIRLVDGSLEDVFVALTGRSPKSDEDEPVSVNPSRGGGIRG